MYNLFCLFFQQEPGKNGTEIMNCLKYVRPGNNFEPRFPLLEKIEVNGQNEHPLYTYLKVRFKYFSNVPRAFLLH